MNQYVAVCRAWASDKTISVADLLVERGWIDGQARGEIDRLVERKLKRHGNDPRVTLGAVAAPATIELLRGVDDDVRGILTTLAQEGEIRPAALPETQRASSDGAGRLDPAASPLQTLALPPGSCSRYSLRRVQGEGGLGRVWEARDNVLNRTVALKELRPNHSGSLQAVKGFFREAQIAGQLEHPNIVAVHDMGRRPEDDQPYYIMRLVRGDTMKRAIADHHLRRREGREDRLQQARLLNAFVSVCNAVGYAHSREVIHRDLKPENIILGAFGEVIVLDWGLAKITGQKELDASQPSVELTEDARADRSVSGEVLGTPAYMAPEQARGQTDTLGPHTDIYGLGAILFEILTGAHPHQGPGVSEVLDRIINHPTPRARSVEPSVRPALDSICAKAMDKLPSRRYGRATDLAEDVQKWLADEPVAAHRESPLERASRWARRHRSWTQSAAVALVAVTVISLVAMRWVDRARLNELRAKDEATRRLQEAREAADTLLTGVSQGLEKVPGAQDVRTKLLQKAADFYERFASDRSGDLKLRLESGHALNRLAEVRRILSDFDGSDRAYGKAEALYAGLARALPDDPGPRLGQCNSLIGRGLTLQVMGREVQAETAFGEAISRLEGLVKAAPGDALYRSRLAFAETSLGNLLAARKDGNSESPYRRALATYDALVKADPEAPSYRSDRARSRINLAVLYYHRGRDLKEAGRRSEADAALLGAETLYRDAMTDLASLDPRVPEYRDRLARCRINLSLVLQALGRPADAEHELRAAVADYERLIYRTVPEYAVGLVDAQINLATLLSDGRRAEGARQANLQAMELCQRLVDANPDVKDYRRSLGAAANNVGILLNDLGRPEEALRAQDQAVEVREGLVNEYPDRMDFQEELRNTLSQRCLTLRALGREDDLVADAERLARLAPRSPTDLFNAGCHLSWAAGRLDRPRPEVARRLRDRAVGLLKQAVDLDPDKVAALDDEDLAAVRDHPAFSPLKNSRGPKPSP